MSVWLKGTLIVLCEARVLLIIAQNAISYRQEFDVGAHKAGKSVFGRADNWLTAYVETCIYEDGTAG